MSNILLTGTSKSTGPQTKDAMQVSESKSFLEEFNQASQTSSFKPTKLVSGSQSSGSPVITTMDVDLSEPLEKTDIELIFAQLDMAHAFDKSKGDGKILPIFEVKAESETADDSDLDAITQVLSSIDDVDSEISDDITLLENGLFSNTIPLPVQGEPNDVFLASLSHSEKDLLSNFSTLSTEQLIALSHDDLVNLIEDYNLQAPVLDESIVDLADKNLDVKLDTVAVAQMATFTTAGFNMVKNVTKDSVTSLNNDNILGNKTASADNVLDTVTMAQADLKMQASAESLKTASVTASMNIDSELVKSAHIDVFTTSDETVDIKAIQNQSSFTPIHKSEVPQFQLSLKQQGEPQVQMQEMIQRFSPVMKQQLITMVSNGIQQAEIRLDPPELGHLTVKIQINGDQTQVQFHVAQSQTRELIEQAIPRLRDMLAQEGLQLTDSQVSQGGGGRDGQPEDSSSRYAEQQDVDENSAVEHSMFQNHPESLQSGIDYYA
ncbi:flagellar hook-length control protein FliK [Shewanella sp. OMA3-2]|uniref:flagellar hook-length control protein FliK n=1 Tax=Shewanella sp. OMA3-2 TaxID=2908650 RepID=UPI001F3EBC57|nr:flagellar hook-length control protein FliK [Shewanella sp. OMA3-2]UJF21298.1 flagellar hook-length control protein FliK [Shewanella sp. OMA3-2]